MRRLAGIVSLLVLLSAALPVLACMTVNVMNHEESACCRAMHGKCGQMTKMDCCVTQIQTDAHPQIAADAPSMDLHWAVIRWLTPALVVAQPAPSSLLAVYGEHSPPGLLTATTIILRI